MHKKIKNYPPIILIGKKSVSLLLWFLFLWLLGMLVISSCLCTCSLFCDMIVCYNKAIYNIVYCYNM